MDEPNETPPDSIVPSLDVRSRRGIGIWGILLLLVIVFGYVNPERRAAIGRFAEQVADIIRDFRGYDPEF